MKAYAAAALRAALREAELQYPREACGIIARKGERSFFVAVENVVDRYHRADPASFPLDSRQAYLFDPRQQRRLWQATETGGFCIQAIVHSHCDADAEFSAWDRSFAMADPETPLHPGLEYLIFSLAAGRFRELRAWRWEGGAWQGRPIPFPAT